MDGARYDPGQRTFYENFNGKESCYLAAFDIVVAHLRSLIAEAIEPVPDWPHSVLAGLSYTQMLWMGLRTKAAYLPG